MQDSISIRLHESLCVVDPILFSGIVRNSGTKAQNVSTLVLQARNDAVAIFTTVRLHDSIVWKL